MTEAGYKPVFFKPRPLRNLLLVDESPSLMPLTDMKVANLLGEEIPQLYCTTGRWAARVWGHGGRGLDGERQGEERSCSSTAPPAGGHRAKRSWR